MPDSIILFSSSGIEYAVSATIGGPTDRLVIRFTDVSGGFEAIHLRHVDIHQHEIKSFLFDSFQRFPAVFGFHDSEAYLSQHFLDDQSG